MVKKKVIGIVGSRRRNRQRDFNAVYDALMEIYEDGDWLCSGGCAEGADSFAAQIAKDYGIPILTFFARWSKGKWAGIERNTHIARHSDVLIACVASNRKGGTEDTIRKFEILHPDRKLILLEEK